MQHIHRASRSIDRQLMKKISVFAMWSYRRVLRISWKHHVSNQKVLRQIGKQQDIAFMIIKRIKEYFEYMKGYNKYRLQHLALQGKIGGKRSSGSRRYS